MKNQDRQAYLDLRYLLYYLWEHVAEKVERQSIEITDIQLDLIRRAPQWAVQDILTELGLDCYVHTHVPAGNSPRNRRTHIVYFKIREPLQISPQPSQS